VSRFSTPLKENLSPISFATARFHVFIIRYENFPGLTNKADRSIGIVRIGVRTTIPTAVIISLKVDFLECGKVHSNIRLR